MRAVLLVFGLVYSSTSLAQFSPTPESMALRLDTATCAKIPNGNYVPVSFDPLNPSSRKFKMFYFSPAPFNPKLPSAIVMGGGPGVIFTAPPTLFDEVLPGHNIFYLHPRGGGCGDFPLDKNFDSLITTEFVAHDIETLRKALKIPSWSAFVGVSYDTNTARTYARLFPNHVKMLVLDSLDAGDEDELAHLPMFYRVLNKLSEDAEARMGGHLNAQQVANTKRQIEEDILQVMLYPGSIVAWLTDQGLGKAMELKRSREYGLALLSLIYEGEMDEATHVTHQFVLFGEFHPAFRASLLPVHLKLLTDLEREYFSFMFPDYADISKEGSLNSQRVFDSMTENDSDRLQMCTKVPALVLQGELDVATPLSMALRELSQPHCMTGPLTVMAFAKLGHSVISSSECAQALVREAVRGRLSKRSLLPECREERVRALDPRNTRTQ